MAWTNPIDPVTNTVITVAYAVANLLTQIRWLRIMTGNADPSGSNQVVVSSSTSATAWGQVPTDAVANLAITTGKLANATITQAKLANDAVGTAQLINANVTEAKLADLAVTTNKLANTTITQGKMANSSVGTAQLIDANVTEAKLADLNVTTGKLAAAAVTPAKLDRAYARYAAGTYTGNGASNRQITTGFACSFVVLTWVNTGSGSSGQVTMLSTADNTSIIWANTSGTTAIFSVAGTSKLHGSDGFQVDAAGINAVGNVSGETYRYAAFG